MAESTRVKDYKRRRKEKVIPRLEEPASYRRGRVYDRKDWIIITFGP